MALEVVDVQPVGSTAQLGLVTTTFHVAAVRSWHPAIENVVCTVALSGIFGSCKTVTCRLASLGASYTGHIVSIDWSAPRQSTISLALGVAPEVRPVWNPHVGLRARVGWVTIKSQAVGTTTWLCLISIAGRVALRLICSFDCTVCKRETTVALLKVLDTSIWVVLVRAEGKACLNCHVVRIEGGCLDCPANISPAALILPGPRDRIW